DFLVLHREVRVRVDGALLGHQVADVTVGCEHLEVAAEIFLDGLGLGGRFNDDEILAHDGYTVCGSKKRAVARATTPVMLCAGRSPRALPRPCPRTRGLPCGPMRSPLPAG